MIQPIGYLKLYRELASKAIWANSNSKQRNILITVLMMAWFKDSEWDWKGEKFKTQPGQFVTSLESIAKECGNDVSVQNVRTALTKFESLGFLTNKSTNKNRLITIVNWALYQQDKDLSNKQINRQLTINQQATNNQLTTKEEGKEGKNEYIVFGEFKRVRFTQEEIDKIKSRYGESVFLDFVSRMDIYGEANNKKYPSCYATMLNWIKKDGIPEIINKPHKKLEYVEMEFPK